MTEECYNKFVNLFLLDSLVTGIDRHGENYKFIKNKNSKLWEDVIALDHELLSISDFMRLYDYNGSSKDRFQDFLTDVKDTYYPFDYEKFISHRDRIKKINSLIASGDLSPESIAFLKSATEYDYPKIYRDVHKEYLLTTGTDYNYDMISRLWDYNRETLELR